MGHYCALLLAFTVSLLVDAESMRCNCGALHLSSLPCVDENNLMKYEHEVDCNLIVKCNMSWGVDGWSIM